MSLERKWSVPNKMRSTKITPYTPDNDFLSSAGIFLNRSLKVYKYLSSY